MKLRLPLFQGILLGAFCLAALVGLIVFAAHKGQSGGANEGVGPVVLWGVLPRSAMLSALSAAGGAGNAFQGVTYVQKDPATLPQDLAAAIATGAAPDLVLASQEELLSIEKFLEPIPFSALPARTYQNTFIAESSLFSDGATGYYGVPFLVDPLELFYNRDLLAAGGVAEPPSTWEALIGLVPRLAVLTPAKSVSQGLIALGTYGNVHDARGILSALFLQAGVPMSAETAAGPAAQFEVPAAGASPAASALVFYTQFADPSKTSYTWNPSLPDSQTWFAAGNLALYLGYASEASFFNGSNPNLAYDAAPLPQPQTASGKATYGLLYAFMIPNGAAHAAGALKTAELLAGVGAQQAAAGATGLAPAALSALSAPPSNALAAVAYASALYAKGWLSPAPADTDGVFSAMISDVISGRSTPETALSDAERSLDALFPR